LTHEERVKVLGEAVLRSGAIVFTKNHAGKYTAVNDDYLAAFGFDDSSDVVGKSDDEIVETLLGRGQTFHHSYRGESITDLPAIWRAHDEMALERPMWFKERSLLGGGVDTKLHEFVVMKAPFEDGIIGVAVSEGT
jgi:PAS domain-containing protein